MSTKKTMLADAIAESKLIKEAALIQARLSLGEVLTPRLKELVNLKLQEMEEEDYDSEGMDDDLEEEFDLDSVLSELEGEEDDTLDETKDKDEEEEKPKKDDKPKPKNDKPKDEESESISDMNIEELKDLIKSVLSDELDSEEDNNIDDSKNGAEDLDNMGGGLGDFKKIILLMKILI